jgi:ceramide glucosyltransferase
VIGLDGALSLAAAVLAALCLAMVAAEWRHYGGRAAPVSDATPGGASGTGRVSILAACRGADPDLYENLLSWVRLDRSTEVLIGVSDAHDEAVPIAEQLAREHPGQVRLILTDHPADHATNPKVWNLIALDREATGDVTVVCDSNVRASSDLLRRLVQPLSDPAVAASYALCVARPPPTAALGSRIEAALFSTMVVPPIAAAYDLAGVPNLIGKVLLIRREVLHSLGGWARYLGYLVEDGRLGRDLRASGQRIVLTDALAEVRLGDMTVGALWEHELRWMVLHRMTLPFVPLGMMVWSPWFLGAAALVTGAAGLKLSPFALGLAAAHNLAIKAVPFLRHGGRLAELWLLPLAEAVLVAASVAVWMVRDVRWRGRRFLLGRGSRILAAEPPAA